MWDASYFSSYKWPFVSQVTQPLEFVLQQRFVVSFEEKDSDTFLKQIQIFSVINFWWFLNHILTPNYARPWLRSSRLLKSDPFLDC